MKNKNTVVRILFALFELVLVELHLSLVYPVEEGDLAAKGVVQLPPREHVLHHLGNKITAGVIDYDHWNRF